VKETFSQFANTVIPGEPRKLALHSIRGLPRTLYGVGRDPWFDVLTTLSEVEGESMEITKNQVILDPGSLPAPRDLAGMTNGDTVSEARGLLEWCRKLVHFVPDEEVFLDNIWLYGYIAI
jgi:hypothetical protein